MRGTARSLRQDATRFPLLMLWGIERNIHAAEAFGQSATGIRMLGPHIEESC